MNDIVDRISEIVGIDKRIAGVGIYLRTVTGIVDTADKRLSAPCLLGILGRLSDILRLTSGQNVVDRREGPRVAAGEITIVCKAGKVLP